MDSIRGDIIRWRCQNRACHGSVYFDVENNLRKMVVHSHGSLPEKIEKLRMVHSFRNRAVSTSERASDIIASHVSSIQNEETVGIMPHIQSLRDYVRRERNNLLEYTPGMYIDIPESLKRDIKGNVFLRFDSGYTDPNRIIIFCSE